MSPYAYNFLEDVGTADIAFEATDAIAGVVPRRADATNDV